MNTLIISSIAFAIILVVVTILLIRTKDLAKYNVFIYVSLFVFWFVMQVFKTNTSNMSAVQELIANKPWVWPIIIALYQFTQVIVRIPIGLMCSKFKSRKLGIQVVTIIFMVAALVLVLSNFSLWSIIIATIASGFVGATFGLNSQYWSENWNIQKVFKSSVIMYTIPLITSSAASIFKYSIKEQYMSMDALRWFILSSLIFASIYMIVYSFAKEKKETIGLDLGAPAEVAQTSKGYIMIWKLTFSACLMAFIHNMLINATLMKRMGLTGGNVSNLMSLISIITLISAIIAGTYLVKNFGIPLIKYTSFTMVIIGILIGFALAITGANYAAAWIVVALLIVFGSIIFQVTIFGVTLHLDHKHPALVLGIFLTARSFANGSGQLMSDELLVNTPNSNNGLYAIFGITLLFGVVGIVFFIINHLRMDKLYKTLQDYEFNLNNNIKNKN